MWSFLRIIISFLTDWDFGDCEPMGLWLSDSLQGDESSPDANQAEANQAGADQTETDQVGEAESEYEPDENEQKYDQEVENYIDNWLEDHVHGDDIHEHRDKVYEEMGKWLGMMEAQGGPGPEDGPADHGLLDHLLREYMTSNNINIIDEQNEQNEQD